MQKMPLLTRKEYLSPKAKKKPPFFDQNILKDLIRELQSHSSASFLRKLEKAMFFLGGLESGEAVAFFRDNYSDLVELLHHLHKKKRMLHAYLYTPAWHATQQSICHCLAIAASFFKQKDWSEVMWFFSKMSIDWQELPAELQEAIFSDTLDHIYDFADQDIGYRLCAFAKLGLTWSELPRVLQEKLLSTIFQRFDTLGSREVANILWGLAVLELPMPILSKLKIHSPLVFNDIDAHQIAQVRLLGYSADVSLTPPASFEPDRSDLEKSVFAEIERVAKRYDLVVTSNPAILSGWLYPDALIENPETHERLIIEMDGPIHFFHTGRPTPSTCLRNRIYEYQGIPYQVIDYHIWNSLNMKGRARYVESLLRPMRALEQKAAPALTMDFDRQTSPTNETTTPTPHPEATAAPSPLLTTKRATI